MTDPRVELKAPQPLTKQDREALLINLRQPAPGMLPDILVIVERYEATVEAALASPSLETRPVLEALRIVLQKWPMLRLGQAVVDALPERFGNDPFHISDEELAERLHHLRATLSPLTPDRPVSAPASSEKALDVYETAFGIIASTFDGDWTKASPRWQEAAARFRDEYDAALRHSDNSSVPTERAYALEEAAKVLEAEAAKIDRQARGGLKEHWPSDTTRTLIHVLKSLAADIRALAAPKEAK